MAFCTNCGNQLPDDDPYCRQCGQPRRNDSQPVSVIVADPLEATGERMEAMAVVSVVVGIAGLVQFPIPLVSNVVAIVLGSVAKNKIRTTPGLRGEGLAVAGIVLGIVGIVLAVLLIVILIFILGAISKSS